jgi:HAMP domain-containing protein
MYAFTLLTLALIGLALTNLTLVFALARRLKRLRRLGRRRTEAPAGGPRRRPTRLAYAG